MVYPYRVDSVDNNTLLTIVAVYSLCAGLPSEITVFNFDTKSTELHFKAENVINTKYEVRARICAAIIQNISEATRK